MINRYGDVEHVVDDVLLVLVDGVFVLGEGFVGDGFGFQALLLVDCGVGALAGFL